MTQRIVAFTGISGVGKTTFLRRLAQLIDFQHVTGGSLIAAARKAKPEGRDAIRHADLDENQRLLIEGFALTRDPSAKIVIMDGHVVIDDGQRLSKIPCEVFKALEVSDMIHFECDPDQIAANRAVDTSRSRPAYQPAVLERHQELSRIHAKDVAEALGLHFEIAARSDVDRLARLLCIA